MTRSQYKAQTSLGMIYAGLPEPSPLAYSKSEKPESLLLRDAVSTAVSTQILCAGENMIVKSEA